MNTAWLKKILWKKVLLCASIYTVVTVILRQIEAIFTMKYYTDPAYSGLWSKVMMPTAGPPPLTFFITSIIFTFVSGVSLAVVYYYLRDLLPKKTWPRILFFADLLVGMSFIFSTLPMYLMFNVPVVLLVSWFISGFIILVSASYIFVKILK